jgi:hypothetical protein
MIQGLGARVALHAPVHDARRHTEQIERLAQVASVVDGDTKRDRASVARQLLDRARHQRVALFDVYGLGQLVFSKIESGAGQARKIRGRRNAIAAQLGQVAVGD